MYYYYYYYGNSIEIKDLRVYKKVIKNVTSEVYFLLPQLQQRFIILILTAESENWSMQQNATS
jgi:hypothetical protein